MSLVLLALATFVSTMLGGLTALKNKDRLHRILGFTAGVLLGVVAFDILPEICELVQEHSLSMTGPMLALVIAFLLFHIFEKSLLIHHAHDSEYRDHQHPHVGLFSALALVGHSFLDGMAIGLGFQVSTEVGAMVAIAVIAHDFSDGLNTVSLMLKSHNTSRKTIVLLVLDALAPVLGVLATMFISLSPQGLVLYLGFFAGFLLYIGASDILPEAHSKHPSRLTMALTVFGAAFMFVVTQAVAF